MNSTDNLKKHLITSALGAAVAVAVPALLFAGAGPAHAAPPALTIHGLAQVRPGDLPLDAQLDQQVAAADDQLQQAVDRIMYYQNTYLTPAMNDQADKQGALANAKRGQALANQGPYSYDGPCSAFAPFDLCQSGIASNVGLANNRVAQAQTDLDDANNKVADDQKQAGVLLQIWQDAANKAQALHNQQGTPCPQCSATPL